MKAKIGALITVAVFISGATAFYLLKDHDHEGHDHAETIIEKHDDHAGHDHSEHGHEEIVKEKHDDHSGHDHAEHGHDEKVEAKHDDHSGHDHAEHGHDEKAEEKHDDHDHDKHAGHGHDDHGHEEKDDDDHDGHDHGSVKAIGEGKAIVEVDDKNGLMLSKEAVKSLEIDLVDFKDGDFTVDSKALVSVKDKYGVYRYRDGFFKLIEIEASARKLKKMRISSRHFKRGDRIVVSGLGPLRIADIFSTDTAEYGHGH